MKQISLLLTLLISAFAIGQTPCENNIANGFPCDGYDLMARITPGEMDAFLANDSWGWTDPQDGKEYAIVGLNNGTAFIDITDPANVIYLGKLDTHNGFIDGGEVWRDIKVYDNHAFIVSEISGHGMQVFDLTRLRNVNNPPESFTEDAHYDGFGSAHNIAINESVGYAYAVGTSSFNGGAHFINIQDPKNPVAAGGYEADFYTHDAQIVTYTGPDSEHDGKELFIGSNADQIVIVDVSTKSNPIKLSGTSYSDVAYTHQAWFTDDHRYLLICDEIDEINSGFNSRTIVFDALDLDNPVVLFEFFGTTQATDHNGYVVGDKFYLANYRAGLRVIDISDIENSNLNEIGYFDTSPDSNGVGTSGTWNVYPFFASENIVISGDAGFTLVRSSDALSISEETDTDFNLFPNPATEKITIHSKKTPIHTIELYNVLGQSVIQLKFSESTSKEIDISNLTTGVYLMKINEATTKRLIVN